MSVTNINKSQEQNENYDESNELSTKFTFFFQKKAGFIKAYLSKKVITIKVQTIPHYN